MFQFLEVMEQGSLEKEQLGKLVESERMWWKLSEECVLWKIDHIKLQLIDLSNELKDSP